MIKKKLPDFLGIGAQKAGTTWIWKNLQIHPGIYLPPAKEFHYFSRNEKYLSPNLPSSYFKRFFDKNAYYCRKHMRKVIVSRGLRNKAWHFKYAFGNYNNQWYLELFDGKNEDEITGEITPAYSMLDYEDIGKVHSIIPDVKLIYIMRNPVERAWSHFKHYVRFSKRSLDSYQVEDMINHFNSDASFLRGNYVRTLDNWLSIFPDSQLFTAFFDEIKDDPKGLLRRLFGFLGLNNAKHYEEKAYLEKAHISISGDMPFECREFLRNKYKPIIRELCNRFSFYPQRWLKEISER